MTHSRQPESNVSSNLRSRSEFPLTIVVVHPKERRSKCSVAPLRGRDDFRFWKFPRVGPEPLGNYVRLGFGGPMLGPEDADHGLLVLDATWRLVGRMEAQFEQVPVRSLPPCQTAYPRISKLIDDPQQGLATVEAIFLAYHLLGRDTSGLLDEYRWGDEFLRLNGFTP